MMNPTVALLTVLTLMLSACGSNPTRPRQTAIYPSLGVVETRGVGEPLINKVSGTLVPDIEIKDDTVIGKHALAKGRYVYNDENSKGIWFGTDAHFYMRKTDGFLCMEATGVCKQAEYTLVKRLQSEGTEGTEGVEQTLLYNGKIGNRITLGYREFSQGLARPAFSNTVDYDLSASNIVGYKGARLEIIEATNTEITYRLLSSFAD